MAICRDAQPASASMIHARNSDTRTLDVPRFNEAFLMHTSTSLHYGVIAYSDLATRLMPGRAGRSLVTEMHEEPLRFRQPTRQDEHALGDAPEWFKYWTTEIVSAEMKSNHRKR